MKKLTLCASVCLLTITTVCIAANKTDLEKFNQTNECINCDLTGIVIHGDHSGARLNHAELDECRLGGIFTRADFSASHLNHVTAFASAFPAALFIDAQMTHANFAGIDFSNADFTGAVLTDSNFSGANFVGAKITSEQLSQAYSIHGAILPNGQKAE